MSAVREIEYRDAVREAMSVEMRRDKRLFLLGEEFGGYKVTLKISRGRL